MKPLLAIAKDISSDHLENITAPESTESFNLGLYTVAGSAEETMMSIITRCVHPM